MPTLENVDPSQLTEEELRIVTRGNTQKPAKSTEPWRYEERRDAQAILDFLYLGPTSAANNPDFLRREGITMLLATRDTRFVKARLLTAEKAAQQLGLSVDYIDVSGNQELIQAFPLAVKKINDHLIQRRRNQALRSPGAGAGAGQDGQMLLDNDGSGSGGGKVLLFCESGNGRSAAVAAAYVMTMFDTDLTRALQFVSGQRFCANFDDETKFLLKSYEDILVARRSVNRSRRESGLSSPPPFAQPSSSAKRRIADTMSDEDSGDSADPSQLGSMLDGERYIDRDPFIPFFDKDTHMS